MRGEEESVDRTEERQGEVRGQNEMERDGEGAKAKDVTGYLKGLRQ